MTFMGYTELVNKIADAEWGRAFETPEDAEKNVVEDLPRLTAYALVELLKRLNAVAKAVGPSPRKVTPGLTIPKDVKRYPEKQVGDRVFYGDLADGISACIIVAKDKDGVCLVATNNFNLDHPPTIRVADEDTFATLEEAVQDAAESDVAYYGRRRTYAEAALNAVKQGKDLAQFLD